MAVIRATCGKEITQMSSVSDTRGVDIDAKCHGDPGTQIGTHVATVG